jgi:hypothetical protein
MTVASDNISSSFYNFSELGVMQSCLPVCFELTLGAQRVHSILVVSVIPMSL